MAKSKTVRPTICATPTTSEEDGERRYQVEAVFGVAQQRVGATQQKRRLCVSRHSAPAATDAASARSHLGSLPRAVWDLLPDHHRYPPSGPRYARPTRASNPVRRFAVRPPIRGRPVEVQDRQHHALEILAVGLGRIASMSSRMVARSRGAACAAARSSGNPRQQLADIEQRVDRDGHWPAPSSPRLGVLEEGAATRQPGVTAGFGLSSACA